MKSAQSRTERLNKSKGVPQGDKSAELNGASELHALDRLGSGFELLEMVSEYRALRASVLQLWGDSHPAADDRDVDDVTRFNESIDQSITKAVASYTRRIDQSRDMFMAILSHDLRNPLGAIAMSAAMLPRLRPVAPEAKDVAEQIARSAQVMTRMINDLLDYTRTRLGAGMPVLPAPIDLKKLCQELCDEFLSSHPERPMRYESFGNLNGDWDDTRLRQAISNLLGNAFQHSTPGAAITLTARAEDTDVVVIVHNAGEPIPPGELGKIFDPLIRGSSAEHPKTNRPGSIGLGLYIAREVAKSHGGSLVVTSTLAAGTAFTLRIPRHFLKKPGQPILDEKHVQKM